MAVDGVSWFWDFGDGTTGTEQTTSHSYSQLGDYTVTLLVTSDKGCEAVNSLSVGIVTGIEESMEKQLDIFPNPLTEERQTLTIRTGLGYGTMSIYNSRGALILERIIVTDESQTLDISLLPNGVYMLTFQLGNESITKKVVIDR